MARLVSRSRLVTLTGTGGIGKSRLAVAVGHDLRDKFPDGVWFVDLAPMTAGMSVDEAVLAVVSDPRATPTGTRKALIDVLRPCQALVVLDNCEHLVDDVIATAAALLAAAPELHILATSRAALGGAGERIVVVPPLQTEPPGGNLAAGTVSQLESVQLLVDRATAWQPAFAVSAQNASAITKLCQLLGGSPLAIELAASRLRSQSIGELLERLSDQFLALEHGDPTAPPRQRSLRAVVDWSWSLCSGPERRLWARASLFARDFDAETAELVCSGGQVSAGDVGNLLDRLVAKSILTPEIRDRTTRFRFLETLRQYGAGRLADYDEVRTAAKRHRDVFAERAESAFAHWSDSGQSSHIEKVREDRHEFSKAIEWSLQTPGEFHSGVRLVHALRYHWAVGGYLGEGSKWLALILQADPLPSRHRATSLWMAGWLSLLAGEHANGERYLNEADALAHELNDHEAASYVQAMRGSAALMRGDAAAAAAEFGAAVTRLRAVGDNAASLLVAMQHVVVLAQLSQIDEARRVGGEALTDSQRMGENWARSQTFWALGYTEWIAGDSGQARRLLQEALRVGGGSNRIGTPLIFDCFAWIAESEGSDEQAILFFGAADRMWEAIGSRVGAFGTILGRHTEEAIDRLRARRSRARFDTAWRAAAAWSDDNAITFALTGKLPSVSTLTLDSVGFTRREREVVALVAQGLSNKEIASSLSVSPRTVDGHVQNVLTKLSFRSRAQVAAWVARGE